MPKVMKSPRAQEPAPRAPVPLWYSQGIAHSNRPCWSPGSAAGEAAAQAYIAPAVVYTTGGKADKSINESVARGLRRVSFVTQVQVPEKVPNSEADFVPMLRDFALQDRSPVIAVGGLQVAAVTQIAKEFPHIQFALLDVGIGDVRVTEEIAQLGSGERGGVEVLVAWERHAALDHRAGRAIVPVEARKHALTILRGVEAFGELALVEAGLALV